ncbi:hypothetical protein WN48_11082 [Eufriesea mexicana]|uniref:Soluble interferon alpha/beta receptor OPG204 n=1 Tax=Eufriesea mexicana TaxID=516756 RepID=A0A310SDE7_9HYME|nr:hypothetical protein WN48_11082 [Eufriesea mexicana]
MEEFDAEVRSPVKMEMVRGEWKRRRNEEAVSKGSSSSENFCRKISDYLEERATRLAGVGELAGFARWTGGKESVPWEKGARIPVGSAKRYKDNRAYPWPGGESHFILYPESANQTIYAQKVRASDAGRYSCRARNDTTFLEGDITLAVLGEKSGGYTGKPLPTYRPASQLVPLGGAARLFCEAYLGKVDLPDAKNSVTWSKSDSNLTLPSHGRIAQHRVSRACRGSLTDESTSSSLPAKHRHAKDSRDHLDLDNRGGGNRATIVSLLGEKLRRNREVAIFIGGRENNQIVGSYLEIEDITLEDYGEYKCEVSNGVDEEITLPAHVYRQEPQFALGLQNGSWRRSFLVGVLVLVLLISAGAFYARCWLPLALLCRDKFAPLEENGSACRSIRAEKSKARPRKPSLFVVRAAPPSKLLSVVHFRRGRCAIGRFPSKQLRGEESGEIGDGKECDALVCYHEKDSSLVIGIVIPTLESRHRYKCTALELSQLNQNCSAHMRLSLGIYLITAYNYLGGLEIGAHATMSRRIIVILSPASLGNVWNETSIGAVLNQLSSLATRTIVIATKDLSNTTMIAKRSSRSCNDGSELSLDRLKILHWDETGNSTSGNQKFWYKLRLAMPPVRPISSESGCQSVAMIVQANGKCGQQKARSRESLEVLV